MGIRADIIQPPIEPRRPTVLDPTYARPEPWFVGDGKGLMIGVVSLCAILIVVRIASVWWIAEEAWRWWQDVEAIEAHSSALAPLPPRSIPAADPRMANTPLRGNPAEAFGPDTYPPEARRAGAQGRTVARLQIDAGGTPRTCDVTTSSGSVVLDEATCRVALARVRFDPPRDGQGRPVPSRYTLPVRWVLPDS